jgi:hypothetical protein
MRRCYRVALDSSIHMRYQAAFHDPRQYPASDFSHSNSYLFQI